MFNGYDNNITIIVTNVIKKFLKENRLCLFEKGTQLAHFTLPYLLQLAVLERKYETAAWQAIREVFPTAALRGCIFHPTQALWRRIKDLGLTRTYTERGATYTFLRMLLAMPFLPPHQIQPSFEALTGRCTAAAGHPLRQFIDYMISQWIESAMHPPATWSAFDSSVRTNNDVEGWHHRINKKASQHPPLYVAIPLLLKESTNVHAQVTSEDLDQDTRQLYIRIEKRLRDATQRYMDDETSTSVFLKTVAGFYSSGRDTRE